MDDTLSDRIRASLRETGECELPPHLEAVAPVASLLCNFARQRGATEEAISALELATVEGLNNAVKHGSAGHPGARLAVRWQLDHGHLVIDITDPGHFAPGPAWCEPPADPLAESGRGGFLIRSLMDEVAHQNGPAGHTLRMQKQLGPSTPRPAAAALEQELAAMTQDLSDSYESLAALFSISELMATTPEFSTFLAAVLARLRTLVSAEKAYVRLIEADGSWRLGGKSGVHDTKTPFRGEPTALERRAWATRHEVTVEHTAGLPADDPLHSMAAGGFICPITFANHAVGVLVVGRRDGAYFSAGQLNLVRTVGDYLAIACTTAELQEQREAQQRVARELQIATSIQQSLLPRRLPVLPGWQVEGLCRSAHEVGGDYFDIIDHPGRGFLVVVADVMGKGLPAALLATIFRTSVRARPDLAPDPANLLTVVNRQLHADLAELDMFITAQIAWFDTADARVRITSAGQGDALRLVAGPGTAPAQMIACPGGMPVGVLPDTMYTAADLPVSPGEALLFLTDGLYEIEDTDGRLLGLHGLAALVRELWHGDPSSLARELLERLSHFGREGQLTDDRTLVVVKRISAP